MDVTEQLDSLMWRPFSEIRRLPTSSGTETVDDDGCRSQLTTWCEQIEPDKYRIVVSLHRIHRLGASRVSAAEGFTIASDGTIDRLDPKEVLDLFL